MQQQIMTAMNQQLALMQRQLHEDMQQQIQRCATELQAAAARAPRTKEGPYGPLKNKPEVADGPVP